MTAMQIRVCRYYCIGISVEFNVQASWILLDRFGSRSLDIPIWESKRALPAI